MDKKFKTVSEETFFVKVEIICGICLDGLRKATQLMLYSWRETHCLFSQDSKRDMMQVSFRGPKNIMRNYM